jgi:hypothetical protein
LHLKAQCLLFRIAVALAVHPFLRLPKLPAIELVCMLDDPMATIGNYCQHLMAILLPHLPRLCLWHYLALMNVMVSARRQVMGTALVVIGCHEATCLSRGCVPGRDDSTRQALVNVYQSRVAEQPIHC